MPDEIYKDPKIWGKHYWFVMKCIAANYPNKPSNGAREKTLLFFNNLVYFLPCDTCKKHYAQLLKKYPVNDKLCCGDCLVAWVEKIQSKIENMKNDRNSGEVSHYNKEINGKDTKSKNNRAVSTKSNLVANTKSKNNRAVSTKSNLENNNKNSNHHFNNKIKSNYDINHDTGNERYFQINTPINTTATYFSNTNARTINNKTNVIAKGTTKFMNNKANNVNAVQNHNTKFTHQKAITFATSTQLPIRTNRKL